MDFETYSRTFLHFHTDDIPDLLSTKLSKNKSGIICDFGAGDGAFLIALKQRGFLVNFEKVIAVDLSKERCDRLRQYTDFYVINSDVTNIKELNAGSIDFVICTQVIEHVDEVELLSEIRRVLVPGGYLYIASIIKKWYGWWYYRTNDGRWAMDPTHLREYSSKDSFETVLSRGGFQIEETRVSRLKLSIIEFIVRRIIVPVFNPREINSYFRRHKIINFLRGKFNFYPPGYFIVESLVRKQK